MQRCDKWGYLAIGLTVGLPPAILPIFLQPKTERAKPWHQRHWVKANVWIAIFSFIGNYFWTHYFYGVLGASYTFPAHMLNEVTSQLFSVELRNGFATQNTLFSKNLLHLISRRESSDYELSISSTNVLLAQKLARAKQHEEKSSQYAITLQVPITLYFMTHAYFLFYHTLANLCLRRVRHAVAHRGLAVERLAAAGVVFSLSYATAYMETLTIAHFPYYSFKVSCSSAPSICPLS